MVDQTNPAPEPASKRSRPLWVTILAWTGLVALLLAAAILTAFIIYFRRAEPILRDRVVETLATRYDSRVELASFDVSAMQGFEVIGSGLKLYPNVLDTQQPLISVDKFSFRIGWRDIFHTPMHIGIVRISGLSINLPPKEQRRNLPRLNSQGSQHGKIEILVDELDIDHASLVLGTSKPGKVPLDFEISNLRMTSVGAGQAMRFHAVLINPKPIGNIDSSGSFGPFDAHSPGDTPISGTYSFSHADLSTIKGIGGILSSTGQYQGQLDSITVDGETDTPDFSLTIANHPVPLHTKFHAIVDGTNGDTHLLPVDAQLLHSHIVASGDIVGVPGQGHNITLDVTVNPARIEDMLILGIKTQPPIMTGALALKTKFYLPPGDGSVTDRLNLQGNFNITGAHFSNPGVQAKVDELSLRSQGEAGQAKQNAEQGISANIASNMTGNFTLGNSKITITGLKYTVPGALIAMNGVYSLDGNVFDFHGTARLQAKVSQMVTGWKSLLLKPVDPFFSKNGAGTEVPISITGTRSNPQFGLDFGHKSRNNSGSTDKIQRPNDGNHIP